MDALLNQLGLDNTFFIELAIIAALFFALSHLFFRPFLKLFEARHKKTVEDREAAVRMMAQAQGKLEEYKRLLSEERLMNKKALDAALVEAKKKESEFLAEARDEAKKITQEAADSVNQQRENLKKQLQSDVDALAKGISDRLLSRKV
ncbi:MAG: ATP synthase F0 subunit B [Bdellovibrionia bacterium]